MSNWQKEEKQKQTALIARTLRKGSLYMQIIEAHVDGEEYGDAYATAMKWRHEAERCEGVLKHLNERQIQQMQDEQP